MKLQNRIAEPDDLVTKEFLHRYNKELQYILKHYKQEKVQRSSQQQRAMKTITQNVRVMKKIQDIQTKKIEEIEKYYKDKIAILQELLRREKRDREIEHRAKIQFLSQLEREKKGEFRRQIDEVLMKYDEEDNKAEIDDNNQEEIEKIFNLYYKK